MSFKTIFCYLDLGKGEHESLNVFYIPPKKVYVNIELYKIGNGTFFTHLWTLKFSEYLLLLFSQTVSKSNVWQYTSLGFFEWMCLQSGIMKCPLKFSVLSMSLKISKCYISFKNIVKTVQILYFRHILSEFIKIYEAYFGEYPDILVLGLELERKRVTIATWI